VIIANMLGCVKMAELYEKTMKKLLSKMDQVDQSVLWCEVNAKVNKQSTAIMKISALLEDFEYGEEPVIKEVKRILNEVVPR